MSQPKDEENEWKSVRQRKPRQREKQEDLSQKSTPLSTSEKNSSDPPFVVLLVGLPGSGKSTFAKAMVQAAPNKFVRINQDVLKKRKKCESLMRKTLRQNKCPIIDRCNFDSQQRDHFWKIAMEERHTLDQGEEVVQVEGVDCIVFSCATNTCIDRCEGRGDTHETIKPGMAKRVVYRMKKDLILPNTEERPWRKLTFLENSGLSNMKKLVREYL